MTVASLVVFFFLPPITLTQTAAVPIRIWSTGPLHPERSTSGIAFGPKGPTLDRPGVATQTSSIFSATRTVVFAGDRIVAVVQTGMRKIDESQVPVSTFQLLSINAKTGQIENRREFEAFASLPIFATDDNHIIVSGRKVFRLEPDLKDAGSLDYTMTGHKHGRVQNISPDGTTLGNATSPGFELISSSTLAPRQLTENPSIDTSVNPHGFITDNVHWIKDFPRILSFVTYVDDRGKHLLYHGNCGASPVFITNEIILEQGCRRPLLIDTQGRSILTLKTKGAFSFAGSSQNGQRFVLQIARFDAMHGLKRERFEILSTKDGRKIAEVIPDAPSGEQSWTALSPDGTLFVVGSAEKLSLWRLP